jgi:N-acetylneuraminate synthase
MRETATIRVGDRLVGDGQPVYSIAEIGINHNGSVELAKKMIDGAALAGCDAVKFQKRTPEKCVPRDQWDIERDTPWGRMTYIAYRHKVEFDFAEYAEIDAHCKAKGIQWFASCWDEDAVAFMEQFSPPCYKVASASVTDKVMLAALRATGRPVILSTGMSTMEEIDAAVQSLHRDRLAIAHAVSLYPCEVKDLNLKMIQTLRHTYPGVPIGYSGHETGLVPTFAAIALGATFIERHITVDRAMWGSDQAASVELDGLKRLMNGVRDVQESLGDGVKRVLDGEAKQAKKLRRTSMDMNAPAMVAHAAAPKAARPANGAGSRLSR